jgi:hypothetical protein
MEQGRLPFEDEQEAADISWFRLWAATIPWTRASTVPDHPHSYWRAGGDPSYARARDTIRAYGEKRPWPPEGVEVWWQGKRVLPRPYRYLQVGDLEYWIGPPGFVNRGEVGRPS